MMMRRMTGGQGKGWRDARQKVMEAGDRMQNFTWQEIDAFNHFLLRFAIIFVKGISCISLLTK